MTLRQCAVARRNDKLPGPDLPAWQGSGALPFPLDIFPALCELLQFLIWRNLCSRVVFLEWRYWQSLFMAGQHLLAADATGTWQWQQAGRNGGATPTTVSAQSSLQRWGEIDWRSLAQPAFWRGRRRRRRCSPEHATGCLSTLSDGMIAGSDVTFSVTRSFWRE